MKEFSLKVGKFFLLTAMIVVIGISVVYKIIDNGNHYKIDTGIKNIILGHSHTMCAFNDTIIKNTVNLSDNGENYFYIFTKLNKLIESNKNIKNVFLSFTNNQINQSYDSTTIWAKKYISYRYPKYAPNIKFDDFCVLLYNNPIDILKNQQKAIKNNIHLILKKNKSVLKGNYWGSFNYLERNKTDSLIKQYKLKKPLKDFKYSQVTLEYLDKIVKLCKEKKVNLYLVRSPIHKLNEELNNDIFFQKLKQEKYNDVEFLDFKDFPLENDYYGDFGHLNHKGSTKFSFFFEGLLEKGLLNEKNKQQFITDEMKIKS